MKRVATILIALAVVIAFAGCDLDDLFGNGDPIEDPLTSSERVAAFMTDVNATVRVPSELQSHFHLDTAERADMGSTDYWSLTFWVADDQPFALNDQQAATDAELTIGSTTYTDAKLITANVTNANSDATGYAVSFWLLENGSLTDDYLIRKIEVTVDENTSEIKQIF